MKVTFSHDFDNEDKVSKSSEKVLKRLKIDGCMHPLLKIDGCSCTLCTRYYEGPEINTSYQLRITYNSCRL